MANMLLCVCFDLVCLDPVADVLATRGPEGPGARAARDGPVVTGILCSMDLWFHGHMHGSLYNM